MSEAKQMQVTLTRFDPDKDEAPRLQTYQIPVQEDWKVLDAINYIKDNVDPSISYRWSCRMAVCGSCGMMVNGEPKLTCKTTLSTYGDSLTIEPLANFPIVRDLVVELDGFMHKFRSVKPWIIRAKEQAEDKAALNEKGTYSQSPDQLSTFKQFSMCINCLLCYAACPVVANEPEFIGPAAIALGHRYNQDSRDEGSAERFEIFRGEGTVFSCSYANECSEVCPKNVDPAAAVNQAKFGAVIDWAKNLVLPRGGA
jgi:fumarate reductase iron-sulfur subunit